jgi:hypothetical protein
MTLAMTDQNASPTKSPVTRFVIWITRGEVPVDGCEDARKEAPAQAPPPPPEAAEPVRWGNFR